jgi:hypothetical protein
MTTKITVQWEGKPVEITVGQITWAESKECIKKSIKEIQKGRNLKKEIDAIYQRELLMLASIKDAPFEKTIDSLNKLSKKDGEKLYEAYSSENETEDDEQGEE